MEVLAVSLSDVEVRIAGSTILGPLDLHVLPGERWALLGPNGSGKTTLLSVAGARRHPSRGRAVVLGAELGRADIRALHARIGHASHALAERMPEGMRVEDVVLTGKDSGLVTWLHRYDDSDRSQAQDLLDDVGCDALVGREIARCSQGERQRVLLARALFGRPELLILDEPAAALDLPAREHLVQALETTFARADTPTLLMATHHLEEIPPSMSHVLLLHDGRVVAAGPIAETLTPAALGACFGLPLNVGRRDGRWWAASPPP